MKTVVVLLFLVVLSSSTFNLTEATDLKYVDEIETQPEGLLGHHHHHHHHHHHQAPAPSPSPSPGHEDGASSRCPFPKPPTPAPTPAV